MRSYFFNIHIFKIRDASNKSLKVLFTISLRDQNMVLFPNHSLSKVNIISYVEIHTSEVIAGIR